MPVHWESCLQGSEIPAAEPARADSDIWTRTAITAGQSNRYGRPTKPKARPEKQRLATQVGHAAEASPPAAVRRRVSRARWPSTAGKASRPVVSTAEGAEPGAQPTEAGPGAR